MLHHLAPERWITPLKFGIEAVAGTVLVTGLIAATGFGASPFFFGYYLIAVVVALTLGRRPTLVFAGVSGLAYVAVLTLDPRAVAYSGSDLMRFSLNVGSVWLLAFLAAVFAAEERRARASVLRLSVTDPLTGLYNRAQLYTTLEQEIRRTRRSERGFCLLMMDLDGLKAVNDAIGHHRGDDVLRALASVIGRSIRGVDTAARYGGDEFVVLLPETDRAGALVVAEKIRAGAEDLSYGMQHEQVRTSVSIGLVYHPDDGSTADDLMIAADRAMYTAKALGKNQISGAPDRRTVGRAPALTRAEPRSADERGTVALRVAPDDLTSTAGGGESSTRSLQGDAERTSGEPAASAAASVADQPAAASPTPQPVMEPERPPADASESAAAGEAHWDPSSNGAVADEADGDLDPAEARRRIAKLSYDPDHQVRRAMDAFLSAPSHPSADDRS